MTQDEIIRMAREAGIGGISEHYGFVPFNTFGAKELERFAALVAAHEREQVMNEPLTKAMWDRFESEIRADEREVIMEIVNTIGGKFAVECAAAIRVSGETK